METGICFRIIVRAQGRSESRCFHVWIGNMYLAILDEVSCRFLSDMRRKICVLLCTLFTHIIYRFLKWSPKDTLLKLRCMYLCSAVSDSVNLSTIAHQLPLPMGFSRQESWSGLWFPSPKSSLTWDQTCISFISCTGMQILTTGSPGKPKIEIPSK